MHHHPLMSLGSHVQVPGYVVAAGQDMLLDDGAQIPRCLLLTLEGLLQCLVVPQEGRNLVLQGVNRVHQAPVHTQGTVTFYKQATSKLPFHDMTHSTKNSDQ